MDSFGGYFENYGYPTGPSTGPSSGSSAVIRLLIGGTSAHLRYLRGPSEQHRGKVPNGQIIDFFWPKIGASRPIEENWPKFGKIGQNAPICTDLSPK